MFAVLLFEYFYAENRNKIMANHDYSISLFYLTPSQN